MNELEEATIEAAIEENFDGWKAVQDLERMSILDVYECAFRHGAEWYAEKAIAAGEQKWK